jgi:hypothetical protein
MRFFPFAFTGAIPTADFYYNVNDYESYITGSTTWYNIGKTRGSNTNLSVSSSWYATDSTGSYIAAPAGTDIKFNGGLNNLSTVSTYIYEIDLNASVNGERFLGRDGITSNRYWCGVDSGFFSATESFSTYLSTLAVNSTMQNQFFYLAIKNLYTGAGYGTTTYLTSLDNFTAEYSVNFSPGAGVAFAFDYLDFIITGMGKVRTIAGYNGQLLSTTQLQEYPLRGPFV